MEARSNIALCSETAGSPKPIGGFHVKDTFEKRISLHRNCQKFRGDGWPR